MVLVHPMFKALHLFNNYIKTSNCMKAPNV